MTTQKYFKLLVPIWGLRGGNARYDSNAIQ